MEPNTEAEAIKPRPDYPPRTPPPPKKPPSPPPPQIRLGPSSLPHRQRSGRGGRPVMRNRQGAAWSLEAQPWAPGKGFTAVADRLRKWGLTAPDCLEDLVRHLVATVVADGGRHVSLHLAEQDGQILLLAFSHQPQLPDLEADVLSRLRELGAGSCGTETAVDGRQVWAVLDLTA
ncbi:hypothetical protein [Streptomyces sp. NBC_01176]|uniref:hypothetical protein n=1 Tax=Streptomyces sp. NBC_01176 TaxID=2903760 RepID=UPI00386D8DB3|nr:hypothetical protein OG199_44290 [Streptomyces sp. NBC_01176]